MVKMSSKSKIKTSTSFDEISVLIIEPFYGGSHKQLVDTLTSELQPCQLCSLPAKKWHWRARTSALWLSQNIPFNTNYRTLFASSVINLTELIALRLDLAKLHKVIYFHENQLVYPVQKQQDRDFQYGYNQILTCLAANTVLFNSTYNMESFLGSINKFLKLIPDHRPKDIPEKIKSKCHVMYFPVKFPIIDIDNEDNAGKRLLGEVGKDKIDEDPYPAAKPSENTERKKIKTNNVLHIVWPHRWEHDKDPTTFFTVLFDLKELGFNFHLSVLGETFETNPDIFTLAEEKLQEEILHWGYLASKEDYYDVLCQADVVVSTALHEFYGVAMLEAVHCGCYPLCPNRLVYPEIFPSECLYSTQIQLLKKLKHFCQRPDLLKKKFPNIDLQQYSWNSLKSGYLKHLQIEQKSEETASYLLENEAHVNKNEAS